MRDTVQQHADACPNRLKASENAPSVPERNEVPDFSKAPCSTRTVLSYPQV